MNSYVFCIGIFLFCILCFFQLSAAKDTNKIVHKAINEAVVNIQKKYDLQLAVAIANKYKDYSQITISGMYSGKLYFWYDIPENKYGTREDKEETYEEALKIIELEEKKFK